MAKRTVTTLLDDLDGGEADETIKFAFDGVAYEIDLSARNASKFRDFMARYLEAANRLGKATGTGAQFNGYSRQSFASKSKTDKELNARIRDWAVRNGYTLSDRGRIPQSVVDAYETKTPNPAMIAADRLAAEQAAENARRSTNGRKSAAAAPRQRARKAVAAPRFQSGK